MEITTKVKEFSLMANGNKAASYVLGGRLLGLAIVLYSALANSISLLDMVIWGAVGIVGTNNRILSSRIAHTSF